MEEDNLLNVCASKFINESGLRDVGAYDNKPHGDWMRKLVDIDSANHLTFEWYYRGEPIAKTVDSEYVTDNPTVRALIISKAKEMMKELRNEDIMKEKKTKKMTKAEAFEYLKGKKVVCNGLNDEDVQRKLFEVGIRWRGGKADVTGAAPFLYINPDGITHGGSFKWFNLHEYEEISADDILSIEIVEEKHELEFNYDKVVELAKPLMHYLNEVRCSDGIRVSQLGIIHEPMSTLVFDNGIGRIE